GAVEHQVFEEVRKTGLAQRLMLGAHVVPYRHGHDGRLAVRVHQHAQAVLKLELLIRDVDLAEQRAGRGRLGDRGFGLRTATGKRDQRGSEGEEEGTEHGYTSCMDCRQGYRLHWGL